MAKRISCIVVRTVPLSESCNALRYARWSNNKHPKADSIVTANVSRPKTHNLAPAILTYKGWLDIAEVSVGNSPIGQILDCYV